MNIWTQTFIDAQKAGLSVREYVERNSEHVILATFSNGTFERITGEQFHGWAGSQS